MKVKTNRGFMLVELMIALALLGMVLALSYQTLHHLWGTYDRTEQQWLAEQEINRVMGEIEKLVRLAYAAELSSDAPIAADEAYNQIYQADGDPSIWMLGAGQAPGEARQVSRRPMTLDFQRAERAAGGAGGLSAGPTHYSDAVQVTVASAEEGVSYSLTTTVHLPNLTRQGFDEGTADAGKRMRVRLSEDATYLYTPSPSLSARCFIATAGYGEHNPSVTLLRRFRDGVLMQNAPGRRLVECYYRVSPPIAQIIAGSPVLRGLTRVLLLPAVGLAVAALHPVFAAAVCAVLAAGIGLVRRRRRGCVKLP